MIYCPWLAKNCTHLSIFFTISPISFSPPILTCLYVSLATSCLIDCKLLRARIVISYSGWFLGATAVEMLNNNLWCKCSHVCCGTLHVASQQNSLEQEMKEKNLTKLKQQGTLQWVEYSYWKEIWPRNWG